MIEMVSLRTFTLATTAGHTIPFEAKVPRPVPADAVSEAMAQGCVPSDAADAPFLEDVTRAKVEFQGNTRKAMLYLAVKAVAVRNNPKDFDASNTPKSAVVADRLGYEVNRAEVADAFQQYMHFSSEGIEPALDAQALNAMKVIEAGDKAELLDLADEFGVGKEKAKGLQMRELRKLLLVKLSGVAAG